MSEIGKKRFSHHQDGWMYVISLVPGLGYVFYFIAGISIYIDICIKMEDFGERGSISLIKQTQNSNID